MGIIDCISVSPVRSLVSSLQCWVADKKYLGPDPTVRTGTIQYMIGLWGLGELLAYASLLSALGICILT